MDNRFEAAAAEARIAAQWEAAGAFAAGANARPGAEAFSIVIPPPNVTGSLHIGHALNNTLQDILVRWHRMRGHDVLWQPGQDHAGIATQMVVERALAREGAPGRREMGRAAFVERVWQQKDESGGTIIAQLRRLGASLDWSRNRFTLGRTEADQMSQAVARVFVELFREGLIYRDKRLVNWDPAFETAISDLEVEQVETTGTLWRLRYPLADGATWAAPIAWDAAGEPVEWETRDYITVATTRPETMLGDSGIAVHPADERYAELVGFHAVLPMVGRRIPIVADEYADPATGTGAVKMTPAHDFNDFAVGKRHRLALINVLSPRAAIAIRDNAAFLAGADPVPECLALDGLDRFEARKRVVAWFEANGLLEGADPHAMVVPHGDRSGVVIEPYLTDQWYVDAKTLAAPALAAVRDGRTRFVPGNWDKTYFQWLENIEPWCISRQLWWGHQIPVWYDDHGNLYCAETEDLARAEAGDIPLRRDEDVLDTWFSSALWPFSTLGWPEQTPELARYYPTAVLSTGFDIIFFWVARMMMLGLHFMREVPFRDVYVHALVRDEQGRKMSKSLGNVIDPLTLIDQYGADAVRMTLTAMASMGRDLRLDVARVEGYRNFVTKLWNAARFAEINGCVPGSFEPKGLTQTVNRWMVGETVRVAQSTDAALAGFRFNDAANGLYAHVWGVLCDWYVELAKPLLLGEDAVAKAETQATMAWALDHCLLLLHPIMPFVTEDLWGQIAPRPKPLVHGDWPDLSAELIDPAADAEIAWVIRLIEGVRRVRAELNVPGAAEIALVLTGGDDQTAARLRRNHALIARLARVAARTADSAPAGSITFALPDCAANLPMAGVIDVAAERARLGKVLAKLAKDIAGIAGKLGNAAFLAKAPDEVVEEQRARLAAAQAEQARLTEAQNRLAEIA